MMDESPIKIKDIIEALLFGGFAVIGSMARTLSDNTSRNKKAGMKLFVAIASNAFIAGFSGLLILPIAKFARMDFYLGFFLAGISGWMGNVFLALIEKITIKRIEDAANNSDK